MKINHHIFAAIAFVLSLSFANGQTSADSVFSQLEFEIPPLDQAIAYAIENSPQIKHQRLIIEQKQLKISLDKKLILRAFTLNSQYSYGNNSAIVNNQLATAPYTSATATNFYSAGLFLNISAFQVSARKKIVETAKLNLKIEEDQLEYIIQDITRQVKELYVDLKVCKEILILRNEAMSVAKLGLDFAEKDFKNHTSGVETYSDAYEAYIKLKIAKEQSYGAYLSKLYDFEKLIGSKN